MEFDELLEHLDDLIALAASEQFPLFAAALIASAELMAQKPALYGVRGDLDRETLRGLLHEMAADAMHASEATPPDQ